MGALSCRTFRAYFRVGEDIHCPLAGQQDPQNVGLRTKRRVWVTVGKTDLKTTFKTKGSVLVGLCFKGLGAWA